MNRIFLSKYQDEIQTINLYLNKLINDKLIVYAIDPKSDLFETKESYGDRILSCQIYKIITSECGFTPSPDTLDKIRQHSTSNILLSQLYDLLPISNFIAGQELTHYKQKADIMEVIICELKESKDKVAKQLLKLMILVLIQHAMFKLNTKDFLLAKLYNSLTMASIVSLLAPLGIFRPKTTPLLQEN
ncbi:hypothetical protein PPL_11570 [Heterostelium album PN500]|uniref:Uncharacterized protein n=1 Tax=Heterostelium pallidum (strain ATCC 26659 / Pp 5 / PN500) TaxID=670386 RepID=D3BVH9_HETP5|nr:hypothetical protein PPL_11570 [Heterostelium album PN500]EFA74602.1 hypothetical protein PPL_11570 [Heterostelium album PN500]|eukprot:XP_020426736.1 hypothetical protein PPL_11570 [Heterostelium album PN500]